MAHPKLKRTKQTDIAKPAQERVESILPPDLHASEINQLSEKWATEIQALRACAFESMEQAIDAVVDMVSKRYAMSQQGRIFLKTLFETDPKIKQDLKKNLQITESGKNNFITRS